MSTWYTPKKGPLLDVTSETPVNTISDHLYIGSLGSARVIKFKAFVKDYKINLASNIEEKKDPLIHGKVYIPTTGDWSWNVSFDLPASNIAESKRNLAKVMELQRMLTMNASQIDWKRVSRTSTSWLVHYKNLICNNNINDYNEAEPESWKQLLKKGAHVWCDEVKYTPDLDMGLFIDNEGTYPKNMTLNLTLNLRNSKKDNDAWLKDYGITDRLYYINSFNNKGQYTGDSSFLTPFGVSLMERGTVADIKEVSELNADCEGEQNFFYISLPYSTAPADLATVDQMGSTVPGGPMPKFLVFKGFLEKFEGTQKVENKTVTVHSHPDNPIKKYNESTKNDDYSYSVTIKVPNGSLDEARRNLGKLQWLIRMYFTKNTQPSLFSTNEISYSLDIQSVRVFLPGLIQKPGTSFVNLNYNHAFATYFHSISAALEFTKLDITFDNEMGFFRSDDSRTDEESGPYVEKNSIYPKSFSISMNFALASNVVYNYELSPAGEFGIFQPSEPSSAEKSKWGTWNGKESQNFPIGSIFNQPSPSTPSPSPSTPSPSSPSSTTPSAPALFSPQLTPPTQIMDVSKAPVQINQARNYADAVTRTILNPSKK